MNHVSSFAKNYLFHWGVQEMSERGGEGQCRKTMIATGAVDLVLFGYL